MMIFDDEYYRKVEIGFYLCHAEIAKKLMWQYGDREGKQLNNVGMLPYLEESIVEIKSATNRRVNFIDGSYILRIARNSKERGKVYYSLRSYKPKRCKEIPLEAPVRCHPVKQWIRDKVLGKAPQG